MLLTMLPLEPRNDRAYPYTLIPIPQDNQNDNGVYIDQNDNNQTCESGEFCGTSWRVFRTTVGLLALPILIFCIMIAIAYNYNLAPLLKPTPPRFFLHSLRVPNFNTSEGGLSATWDLNLTISNYGINFLNLRALIVYKEDQALAANAPIIQTENLWGPRPRGVFVIDKNENKTLRLTFNTTGWERDQPIVDDGVIQEIAKQRKLGVVIGFALKIMVEAEIKYKWLNIPIVMYPYCCSDLEVDFPALERGEVATLYDDVVQVRECSGPVEWYLKERT